jgi:hypothetical protein
MMFFLMDIQVAEYLFSAAASEESQNSPIELTISVSFIGYIFVLAGLSFNLRFWSDRREKDEESWSLQGLWGDRKGKREEVSVTAGCLE